MVDTKNVENNNTNNRSDLAWLIFPFCTVFLFFLASFTVYIENPLKKSVEFFLCSHIICIVDKAHIRAVMFFV